jgi:hypothetical protein
MVRGKARSMAGVAAAVALVVVAAPSVAWASLGDGIPVGPARLHLGVELDGRYESQAGAGIYSGGASGTVQDPGDGVGVVKGVVAMEGKSESFKLDLLGAFDWNQYAGLLGATQSLSYFGSNVTGALMTNPDGAFGFDVTENFVRSDRSVNPVFGLGIIGLTNTTKVRARFRPGGGAIEFGLGGEFGLAAYSPQISAANGANYQACNGLASCDPGLAAAYNGTTFRANFDAKWRFLPKTGITFDASIGTVLYTYGVGSASFNSVPNQNAMPYSAMLGFGTLLSTRFSFAVKAGYQGITFAQDVQANTGAAVGLAEIGFRFTESSSIRLGFQRNIEPVGGIEHWFGDNRIYLETTLQPTAAFSLYGLASVDLIGYGTSPRTDTAVSASFRGEYAMLKWLKLVGAVGLTTRAASNYGTLDAMQAQAFNYTRADVTFGVQALF